MRAIFPFLPLALAITLSGCNSGNLKAAGTHDAPAAPPVQHATYDPYSAYGQANAIWQPPVADRNGTIVKPHEPSTALDRPDYEQAPWMTGAGAGSSVAPRGTF